MANHRTIRIPTAMIEAIENIRKEEPQFGFQSNAEFIKHSVVELMLKLNGNRKNTSEPDLKDDD
jgi:DNA-directed RNA polymerase sigma subunit (sigma70/sigma32)